MIDTGRLSPEQRADHLRRLRREHFDVIVVGGGVTGLGAALDAATRGLSVAVLEAGDLAQGTSSRSGKTLHGGLRYLEQRNFRLVREAAHERNLSVELLCPHLARPTPFLFPLAAGRQRLYLGSGILLYDLLGGARSSRMPWHRHLSRARALSVCPALHPDRVKGAVQYYDVIFDDARHTMLLGRTAVHYGAALATRTPVVELVSEGGRMAGVRATDTEANDSFEVKASCVINAAGAWADRVQELAGHRSVQIQPSKGVHLVLPRDRIQAGAGIVTRTADSVLFVRPWAERFWIVGTTDTPWKHAREDPAPSGADIDYLLAEVNQWLRHPLTRQDIVAAYAGIRPLVAQTDASATAALRRDHAVVPGPDGLFTVVGGKYTTYRRMAQDVVDAAADRIGDAVAASVTERTPLLGAAGWDALKSQRDRIARSSDLSPQQVEHLFRRYGALADEVIELIGERSTLREPLPGASDYLRAEIVYAVSHEGARSLDDVLTRRTHIGIETFDRGTACAPEAVSLIAPILGWTSERCRSELDAYRARVEADQRSELAADDDAAAAARADGQPSSSTRQDRSATSRISRKRS